MKKRVFATRKCRSSGEFRYFESKAAVCLRAVLRKECVGAKPDTLLGPMSIDVDARLATLGLTLPDAPSPAANYVPYTIARSLVFVAVQALGDAGRHARSALGVIALRGNVPVTKPVGHGPTNDRFERIGSRSWVPRSRRAVMGYLLASNRQVHYNPS